MKRGIIAICLMLMLFVSFNTVNADMGDKPSIEVVVKNVDVSKCTFHLLDENSVESDYNLIFIYETDTGIEYSYFNTPKIYKIGITYEDEYKETEVIERKEMHQKIVIDWNTMNLISDNNSVFGIDNISSTLSKLLICVLFTILIELVLSLMFGLRKYWKIILITNICTQLLYNFMVGIGEIPFLTLYLILEAIILVLETYIYFEGMKDMAKGRILVYTILANVITGFLIDKVVFQLLG